ncbi:MAG: CPBP family intramembrane metalloprotease [Planctomycetes bacterium]|nr:CPBP family intramembrane metalloprotease [Planctomycetota bacterium]
MTTFDHGRCSRCREELAEGARFCGHCGEPTARLVAEKRLDAAESARRAGLAVIALLIGFAGTLVAIVVHGFLFRLAARYDPFVFVSGLAMQIAVGALAARTLGRGVAVAVLRGRVPGRRLLEALPAAALAGLVSFVWVALMNRILQRGEVEVEIEPWLLVDMVLCAPLIEEWLCRGVLWRASREVANRGVTLVLTSVLFALLHFLNGGSFLELPHRFVAGLLFGALRLRSGSLWPGVLAHLLLNLAAVSLA